MKKIRKLVQTLGLLLAKPKRLLKVYDEDEIQREAVRKNYGIDQLPTVDLLEVLPDLNMNLSRYSFLEGTSTIPDLVLLKGLASQFRDCVYLEIGSWRGESIANVAEVARKCYSVTLSVEEMGQLGFSQAMINNHGFFSNDLRNIQSFFHNSATFDYSLIKDKCDLIFVDGDHTYEGVKIDSAKVVELLRNDDSAIVWHDYGYSAETVRHSVLAGILDGLPRSYHQHLYHVSNTMCAIYCKKAFKTKQYWKFPMKPNKNFSVSIKATPLSAYSKSA